MQSLDGTPLRENVAVRSYVRGVPPSAAVVVVVSRTAPVGASEKCEIWTLRETFEDEEEGERKGDAEGSMGKQRMTTQSMLT